MIIITVGACVFVTSATASAANVSDPVIRCQEDDGLLNLGCLLDDIEDDGLLCVDVDVLRNDDVTDARIRVPCPETVVVAPAPVVVNTETASSALPVVTH